MKSMKSTSAAAKSLISGVKALLFMLSKSERYQKDILTVKTKLPYKTCIKTQRNQSENTNI